MKLVYHGTHQEVRVPLPLGGEAICKRGVTVIMPDTLAKRLLEQPDNWKKRGK